VRLQPRPRRGACPQHGHRDTRLLCLSGRALAAHPHQQSARAADARDQAPDPRRRRVPGRPVLPQPRGSQAQAHRRHKLVDQTLSRYGRSDAAEFKTVDRLSRRREPINQIPICEKLWTLPGGIPQTSQGPSADCARRRTRTTRPSNPSAKVPSFRAPFSEDCFADMGEFCADEIFGGDGQKRLFVFLARFKRFSWVATQLRKQIPIVLDRISLSTIVE